MRSELSRISQFSYVCESYLRIDLALCQRLISSLWLRKPCRVCMFLCMLLGVLADVCQEVFPVLGVIIPVLVTCLIAVSKYLVNKGKEVFTLVYSF